MAVKHGVRIVYVFVFVQNHWQCLVGGGGGVWRTNVRVYYLKNIIKWISL